MTICLRVILWYDCVPLSDGRVSPRLRFMHKSYIEYKLMINFTVVVLVVTGHFVKYNPVFCWFDFHGNGTTFWVDTIQLMYLYCETKDFVTEHLVRINKLLYLCNVRQWDILSGFKWNGIFQYARSMYDHPKETYFRSCASSLVGYCSDTSAKVIN